MKHHTACYNGHEQEIKQLLMDVASFDTSGDTPESALMIEAAEYIHLLETLLDLSKRMTDMRVVAYRKHDYDGNIASRCIDEWVEFENKQKTLPPEFVKIVEENFWELLV